MNNQWINHKNTLSAGAFKKHAQAKSYFDCPVVAVQALWPHVWLIVYQQHTQAAEIFKAATCHSG